MADKYKEFANQSVAEQQRKAVDRSLGIPKKGVNIGRGPHAHIPDVYTDGAIGWTATECQVIEDSASGNALLVVTDAAVALGVRVVDVDGVPVSLNMASGVVTDKPAKYK